MPSTIAWNCLVSLAKASHWYKFGGEVPVLGTTGSPHPLGSLSGQDDDRKLQIYSKDRPRLLPKLLHAAMEILVEVLYQ